MNIFKDMTFGNGNRYVYYKRLGTDTHFSGAGKVLAKANKVIGKYSDTISSIDLDIVNLLESQASAERAKENAVLKRIDPTINYERLSPIDLINQLNRLIGLGDQYKNYLKYLKNMYSNKSSKYMSPVVTSYISEKIASIINSKYGKKFQKEIAQLIINNATEDQVKTYSENLADQIINDFIADDQGMATELLQQLSNTNYTLGEEYMIWKELLNKINSDLNSKNQFITSIMNNLGLSDKINNAIKKIQETAPGKRNLKASKSAIRKSIKSTAAQKGGLFYEELTALMQGFAVGSNITTSNISNTATTDLVTVKIELDFQDYIKQKLEDLSTDIKSKTDAVQKLSEFTEYLKNNVGEGFIIYGSAKSYKLDRLSDLEGYFKGGTRNIKELPSVMAQYNIPITEDAVELVINTIPNAILENNTQVQEFITEALAGQVAKLLFDDWSTIGDQAGNFDAIHVFNLSGITVPLSYLLEKMAQAARQAGDDLIDHPSSYFQVNFNLPDNIKYPEPDDTTADIIKWKGSPNFKLEEGEKTYLQHAWNEQKKEALRSTFGINFLSNFNNLLNQLMDSIGV